MIEKQRQEINLIDDEISRLLERRFQAVLEIGKIKYEKEIEVQDRKREEFLIKRVKNNVSEFSRSYVERVYREIFKISREFQENEKNVLKSQVFGLLGKGISHSFSKVLHSYLGNYKYELFDLDENDAKNFILSGNYRGLNVTMPYKKLAYLLCDELSNTAKLTGSVNTIVNRNGKIFGYNTDYDGFHKSIVEGKIEVKDKKVVILGSGGVSATIKAVMEELNARSIAVISRKGENNYQNIEKNFDADIIVNATPVGMCPNEEGEIIDISKFKNCKDVIDVVYNPLRTRLLLKSKLCGKNVLNGLSMLVYQGTEASRLFNESSVLPDTKRIIKSIENSKKNIVLIGMPGCGKTTIGKEAAKMLNMKFVDTDEIIECLYGEKCEDIIKSKGENFFRNLEKKAVNKASKISRCVISTGGGVVLDEENMLSLMANGKVFFIKRDFNLISKDHEAVQRSEGTEALYCERKELYKKYADFEISNNNFLCAASRKIKDNYLNF